MNLKKLFRPKSLAIVGGYWADFVYEGNKAIGFNGKVWHINPSRKSSKKKKYYKSIKDLPEVPDCVYLAVSSDLTIKLIKDISEIGVGGTVCLASRFSELNSKEGSKKTKQLRPNTTMNLSYYITIVKKYSQKDFSIFFIKMKTCTVENFLKQTSQS